MSAGCPPNPKPVVLSNDPAIQTVDLSRPDDLVRGTAPVAFAIPQNGFGSFCLQISPSPITPMPRLRLPIWSSGGLPAVSVFQVMSAPDGTTPRVLIPLSVNGGTVDLTTAHRPDSPSQPFGTAPGRPILIWFDIQSAASAPAGLIRGDISLVTDSGQTIGSTSVSVTIDNFEMSTAPAVQIASGASWDSLRADFPETLDGLASRLIDRTDPHTAPAVALLDKLVATAHDNRVDLFIPDIAPIVKWPVDATPTCDWSLFDSLVGPWFSGTAFADKKPVGFWPLPVAPSLGQFDAQSQTQYWTAAAAHFGAKSWLPLTAAMVPVDPGDNNSDSIIANQSRAALAVPLPFRVMIPSTIDRFAIQTAVPGEPTGLASSARIFTRSPGEIFPSPLIDVTPNPAAGRWLAGHPRLGDEQEIRTEGWLAYQRGAALIHWADAMAASDASHPAPAAWFVPGKPFGIEGPLQTIQLKWARQAEQDYEYLVRSNQRGRGAAATQLCRLLTRTIRLQPTQGIDPEFSLIVGLTDRSACERCRRLLVASDRQAAAGPLPDLSRWIDAHQSAVIIPTGVNWKWRRDSTEGFTAPDATGHWVSADVTADVYNPGETSTAENQFAWATADHGWGVHPQPVGFPPIPVGELRRVAVTGWYDLTQIDPKSDSQIALNYTDGDTRETMPVLMNLPVANCDRRTRAVHLDGSLEDWADEDALNLDKPLVKMLSRDSVAGHKIEPAELPSSIYSGWSDENLYVAFRVGGVGNFPGSVFHNDVKYENGIATGENLCEILVQPIYIDDTTGPATHIVCRPGGVWVERKTGDGAAAGQWIPYDAGGIRIASTFDGKARLWRSELEIPWRAIIPPDRGRPSLLRFNFIQHREETNESASWAGPLYESRQSGLTGLLLVRDESRLGR
jgi:hypothetical protein